MNTDPVWGIRRQGTAASHRSQRRTPSWVTVSAPTGAQQADTGLTPDNYSVYRLGWSDLKAWLEGRFPGIVLPVVGQCRNDAWVFNVPQKLNDDDRKNIAVMRDEIDRRRKQAAAAAAAANGRGGHPASSTQPANSAGRRVRSPERQRRH